LAKAARRSEKDCPEITKFEGREHYENFEYTSIKTIIPEQIIKIGPKLLLNKYSKQHKLRPLKSGFEYTINGEKKH
jgi:hypothetical protein